NFKFVGLGGERGGSLQELPNGNILITFNRQNKVVEIDDNGKQVWSWSVPVPPQAVAKPNAKPIAQPISAQRLPDGNTLIGCSDGQLLEVDRQGREVWTHSLTGLLTAKRR